MYVIYVDDELLARENFSAKAAEIPEIERLQLFESGDAALEYAREHVVDVAFLDLEMPGLHGLDLARELKRLYPDVRIVFLTAHSRYAMDAWKLDAIGYLLKPYLAEDVRRELDKCVYRALPSRRVVIQTIPTLAITVDGRPVHISRAKPRELFALLVEKGNGGLTTAEGISCLWPDRPNDINTQSLFRMTYQRLLSALNEAGIGHIIHTSNNHRCLRCEDVDCDLYRILAGDAQAAAAFNGAYLQEYAWSARRAKQLSRMLGLSN